MKIKNIFTCCDTYVWLIAIVCLYAILQIKFEFAFWVGRADNNAAINEILISLAYSFIAGCIVYFLTVRVPYHMMRMKVKAALEVKVNLIRTNYRTSSESVLPFGKKWPGVPNREEVIHAFKDVSYISACQLSTVGQDVSIAEFIKKKHEENMGLVSQILEYKTWLTSETLIQIESLRNSDLSKFIVAITFPVTVSLLDNEMTREKLANQVFDLLETSLTISL